MILGMRRCNIEWDFIIIDWPRRRKRGSFDVTSSVLFINPYLCSSGGCQAVVDLFAPFDVLVQGLIAWAIRNVSSSAAVIVLLGVLMNGRVNLFSLLFVDDEKKSTFNGSFFHTWTILVTKC